jgi:hypothetical protein
MNSPEPRFNKCRLGLLVLGVVASLFPLLGQNLTSTRFPGRNVTVTVLH